MKTPKISLPVLIVIMTFIVLLSFAFVQFQNNNRKMDIQERQIKQEKLQESLRGINLLDCLNDADTKYFEYAELNGSKNPDGSIRATAYVWNKAREDKDAAVKICELKYGK
jgi:gamma-glutamylcyclotransferase (GGCT)/AIG2-like uncharacterized protein YtfP